MVSMIQKGVNYLWNKTHEQQRVPVIDLNDLSPSELMLYAGQNSSEPWEHSRYDGDKFWGGYGSTQILDIDYPTLRARSLELFTTNLYARGIIRRLVTNEINTGLTPDLTPNEQLLGLIKDSLNDWSDITEDRFEIWANNPELCDYEGVNTFAEIQRIQRSEALVGGDVLIVMRFSRFHPLPRVQLIRGDLIETPGLGGGDNVRKNHTVKHGVEFDTRNKRVAHWIRQKDGTFKRIPMFGEKSKRKLSWMVYGTDKLIDGIRGLPLLAIMLQSTKEIDRYRDSVQRKATNNSHLTMFIKKDNAKMGSLPLTGGASRVDTVTASETGSTRSFKSARTMPGTTFEELQAGEEPVLLGGEGTDVKFGEFEQTIIYAIAWSNQIPPEILVLAFTNNYSASQAAINEFKIYLNMRWTIEGDTFCKPILTQWLISELLLGKNKAPGLLDAWRDSTQYDILGAWLVMDWYGSIKVSTDMVKQGKGSKLLVDEAWSTNTREARMNTGTKFRKNVAQLKRENILKADAMAPLIEARERLNATAAAGSGGPNIETISDSIIEAVSDQLTELNAVEN